MASAWILAARPKTLLASLSPVALGASLALHDGVFHAPSATAAALGAVAIQVGTNYCNDYCDFFQGADTRDRKGPTRAVQSGRITPAAMLTGTVLMFAAAAIVAWYLYLRAGWPFLLIGALSVAFGVLYTAGRYSLAYLGLGDPFVLVFFGPVAVAGTYYVQARSLPGLVVVAGLAPGLLSVGLLVVNNLRDVLEDRAADKKTLVVRFGVVFGRLEYTLAVLLASCVPLVMWVLGAPPSLLLASLVLLPAAVVARKVWRSTGVELGPCLGMTAGLLLMYTTLFCLGLGLSR